MRKKLKPLGLSASLVLYVFVIMVSALLLSMVAMTVFNYMGLIDLRGIDPPTELRGSFNFFIIFRSFLALTICSIIFGGILSAFLSRQTLRPIRRLIIGLIL